jgi:hypothetical protein
MSAPPGLPYILEALRSGILPALIHFEKAGGDQQNGPMDEFRDLSVQSTLGGSLVFYSVLRRMERAFETIDRMDLTPLRWIKFMDGLQSSCDDPLDFESPVR